MWDSRNRPLRLMTATALAVRHPLVVIRDDNMLTRAPAERHRCRECRVAEMTAVPIACKRANVSGCTLSLFQASE